jgi:iron complex outermembrane receptor protein
MKRKLTPTVLLTVSLCAQIGLSSQIVNSAEEPLAFVDTLPTTVVSALRYSELDMQIASRVQLIDVKDIANSGATDLVQLLQDEANLHFTSTSGNTAQSQVSMGGYGENSGQRVLVLLDGQRLNTADLGQINWLSIPLGLVESVEVIRGGQSALYGNNAVGGVIKIITRRPSEELSGQVQTSLGSFDSYNGRFALTGAKGVFGYSVHAEHDETDGHRENSQYKADGAGLKLDWTPSNWFTAYGSLTRVRSEYGLPGPLTRAELKADREQSTEMDNNGDEDVLYLRGGLGFYISDELTLSLDGGYTDRELNSEYYYDNISYPYYYLEQSYEIFSFSPSFTFENEQVSAMFGVDYYDDVVTATANDLYSTSEYGYKRETLAAFSSFAWRLSKEWSLAGSLRVEDTKTRGNNAGVESLALDDDEYAWSFGLIRFVGNSSRIYGTLRRFYRYPAADEVIDVFSGPLPVINYELDPETGHEVELGGDTVHGSLTLGGRVFYQWMNDEIIYDSSIGMFGSNANLDETERLGADLTASYQLSETIDASLTYTWVHAEIATGAYEGSEVPLVPKHKLRLQFEYGLRDTILLTAGASYTDDVHVGGDFANASDELEGYLLFDLGVRYAMNDDIDVFAAVDNLFGKGYVSTAFGPDGLYPGVGRSGRVGLLWKF